uniref:cytochrome-c oxidase n=1 Tax=Polytomella sp. Pringsheim 198.80 TaxID=37502 RepID=Q9AR29_9CHLO|nr:cytochrome c oxidase subunit II [Polytomella sp. Pringsheim 198.80]AAK32115.1 cytochrome c oxidase subunit II [Polytomella sp. Pringsheim 198.80]
MLAQRISSGNSLQCGKYMWNAAQMGSKNIATVSETVQASTAAPEVGAQFSFKEASAMASKKQNVVGSGLSLASRQTFSGSFAASAPSGARAIATQAEAKAQTETSSIKKFIKAAAAVVAALGLTAGTASAEAPVAWQLGFQDSATSQAQAAFDLHHDIFFFLLNTVVLVFYFLYHIATKFHYTKQALPEKLTHHTAIEVIWTVIPTIIVVLIAIPSLTLVYAIDSHNDKPGLTVKVIGRQWYWSYEMHDHLQHKLLDADRLVAIAEKTITK